MNVLPVDKRRIFGIETEYGVHPVGGDYAMGASQVNAFLPSYLHPNVEGFCEYGRIYPDQGKNIEVCTPELITLNGLLASHFAGEQLAQEVATGIFGGEAHAQKRSVDYILRSRGEHDNFLIGSGFSYSDQIKLAAHLVSRLVLTGPGVVYAVTPERWAYAIDSRGLVTRGDQVVSGGSTDDWRKPFMKTMASDDAFDDKHNTQRLQVVCSSQNMYAFPIAARIFNTSSVLRLIEQDRYPDYLHFLDPYQAIAQVTRDTTLQTSLELGNRKRRTAAEVQLELLSAAMKLDLPEEEMSMAVLSSSILTDMKEGRADEWGGYVEWHDKLRLLQDHADNKGYDYLSTRTAEIDIKWHELSVEPESLAARMRRMGKVAMMPGPQAIRAAKRMAPDPTRGQVRGYAIRAAAKRGVGMGAVNWHVWQANDRTKPTRVNNAYTRELRT